MFILLTRVLNDAIFVVAKENGAWITLHGKERNTRHWIDIRMHFDVTYGYDYFIIILILFVITITTTSTSFKILDDHSDDIITLDYKWFTIQTSSFGFYDCDIIIDNYG